MDLVAGTYETASHQIAEETWKLAPNLRDILNHKDRVSSLNFPYVRSTVFQALKLVDGGKYQEAEQYLKQRSQGCRNTLEYKNALEVVNLSIQLLIQWKQNFQKWKKDIETNVNSTLVRFKEMLNSASLPYKEAEETYQEVSKKLNDFSKNLLTHLQRDIDKTARGLIGIVKFTDPKKPDISEIKSLQLITNLSANCSIRKYASSTSKFQSYLLELRRNSVIKPINEVRIEVESLVNDHKRLSSAATTDAAKEEIRNKYRTKIHNSLKLSQSEWATLNLDYKGTDGRPYRYGEIDYIIDTSINDLLNKLWGLPGLSLIANNCLNGLNNDYYSEATFNLTQSSLQNVQDIHAKINTLPQELNFEDPLIAPKETDLLNIRTGLETIIDWFDPIKQPDMLKIRKNNAEELAFFQSITRNTLILKDDRDWKVSNLPRNSSTNHQAKHFNISRSSEILTQLYTGKRPVEAIHEFAHVIDEKPLVLKKVLDYLDQHCKKDASNPKIYTCSWLKFLQYNSIQTHVSPHDNENAEHVLHLIPVIFEKLYDDPVEFFETIPQELANLVWLVLDVVGDRSTPVTV